MATVLRPDGKIFKTFPKRGVFSRAELTSLVGVDFEIITLMTDDLMLLQKDFKNKDLVLNTLATIFARKIVKRVHGTAIICEVNEID